MCGKHVLEVFTNVAVATDTTKPTTPNNTHRYMQPASYRPPNPRTHPNTAYNEVRSIGAQEHNNTLPKPHTLTRPVYTTTSTHTD
jgi:hypothetical protein